MSHDHDEKDAKGGELSQAVEEAISNMGEAFFYRDSADKRIAARQALTKAIQADTARILAENAEIIALYDKLQANRLGMHPLIAAMCQVAAGVGMDEAMRDIGYVVARQVPEGWVMVPKEATWQMLAAGYEGFYRSKASLNSGFSQQAAYRAAINAAPPSPTATDVSQYSKPDRAPGEDGFPYG